jgi:hypothetical protein
MTLLMTSSCLSLLRAASSERQCVRLHRGSCRAPDDAKSIGSEADHVDDIDDPASNFYCCCCCGHSRRRATSWFTRRKHVGCKTSNAVSDAVDNVPSAQSDRSCRCRPHAATPSGNGERTPSARNCRSASFSEPSSSTLPCRRGHDDDGLNRHHQQQQQHSMTLGGKRVQPIPPPPPINIVNQNCSDGSDWVVLADTTETVDWTVSAPVTAPLSTRSMATCAPTQPNAGGGGKLRIAKNTNKNTVLHKNQLADRLSTAKMNID